MNFHPIINFSLIVLTFTNVWVILYKKILNILNFYYKPTITDTFYRPEAVAPEPFEMPLYILLSLLFVIIIIFSRSFFRTLDKYNSSFPLTIGKLIFLFILFTFFIGKLGVFPLANETYPYQLRQDKSIYLFILTFYLGLIAFIILQFVIVERLLRGKKTFNIIFYLLILFMIAFFLFEPRFPSLPYEYSYFLGPIWDVLKGKTLFTNTGSDYGFFSILFFAPLYKLKLFQFSHLSIYIWLLFVAQYFLVFYLIYNISKSTLLSLIGTFAVITVNYYSSFIIPITVPQYSAMRRLPAILLLFLLLKFKRVDSFYFLSISALFGFWIIDTGVAMYMAISNTLFLLFVSGLLKLKKFILSLLIMLLSLAGVFLFINLVHMIFGYQPIDYFQLLSTVRQYTSSGLTMIPLMERDFFWLVVLFYFASIVYVIKQKIEDGKWKISPIILLSANLTFFNALYYVGRSHPSNLLDISVLVILNVFLLLGIFWRKIYSFKFKFIAAAIVFLLFIAFPAYERRFTLTELILAKIQRIKSGSIFKPEMNHEYVKFFKKETDLINKYIRDKNAVILSRDDTYLFIASDKRNLLRVNPQAAIYSTSEMDKAIQDIASFCPREIAVDCTIYKKCSNFSSYTKKDYFTAPYILQAIENKCRMNFEPVECTDKLCIVKAKKHD